MSAYDEKLLGSAPLTTKAERQHGYDAALLEKGPTPPPLPNTSGNPSYGRSVQAGAQYSASSAQGHAPQDLASNLTYSKQLPFWRTRKGKVTIGVVALVIIAIIAGVVGGVVGSRKGSNSQAQMAGPANDGPASISPSANPTQNSGPPASMSVSGGSSTLSGVMHASTSSHSAGATSNVSPAGAPTTVLAASTSAESPNPSLTEPNGVIPNNPNTTGGPR